MPFRLTIYLSAAAVVASVLGGNSWVRLVQWESKTIQRERVVSEGALSVGQEGEEGKERPGARRPVGATKGYY